MTNVMKCPKCRTECYRDEVDIGVGVLNGPWGCPGCGWSEYEEYDVSIVELPLTEDGYAYDQWGTKYPSGHPYTMALLDAAAKRPEDKPVLFSWWGLTMLLLLIIGGYTALYYIGTWLDRLFGYIQGVM